MIEIKSCNGAEIKTERTWRWGAIERFVLDHDIEAKYFELANLIDCLEPDADGLYRVASYLFELEDGGFYSVEGMMEALEKEVVRVSYKVEK